MKAIANTSPREQVRCAWIELQTALDWLRRDRPDQAEACAEAAMERLEKLLDVGPEQRMASLRP